MRLYGHSDLPKAEQEVRFFVWSADLREKRGGSWILPLILVWALDWTSKAQLRRRARCRPSGCNSSCTMLRASLGRPLGLTDLTLSVYIAEGSRDSCVPAENGRGIPLEACALASEEVFNVCLSEFYGDLSRRAALTSRKLWPPTEQRALRISPILHGRRPQW